MSSSWGSSWASSWGSSWGTVSTPACANDTWGGSWGYAWACTWARIKAVTTPSVIPVTGGGGRRKKQKDKFYEEMTQDLLNRYYALERRTLPPPTTPVDLTPELPIEDRVEEIITPFTSELGVIRVKLGKEPNKRIAKDLRKKLRELEADAKQIRSRIQKEIKIREWDAEIVRLMAIIDD